MKELTESVAVSTFRNQFESSRSFDLEDDMEFCPKLLTESDVSIPAPPTPPSLPLTIRPVSCWAPLAETTDNRPAAG
jgi:hypothetical protein